MKEFVIEIEARAKKKVTVTVNGDAEDAFTAALEALGDDPANAEWDNAVVDCFDVVSVADLSSDDIFADSIYDEQRDEKLLSCSA